MNKVKISENFMLSEFECKDNSHLVMVDEKLIALLQRLREFIGKPVRILSGYRTPEHNEKIGGAEDSYHMKGMAADIAVTGIRPDELAKIAEHIGFTGIGTYTTFVHVDCRPTKARWRG